MSDLGDKLLEIKRQKDEYILPENIKKDITVYGVTGTLETGSGSGDVKLFKTVEEMQQDTTAQEGDLAVVYRSEMQSITEESEFDSCTFPNTVVLGSAFSGGTYGIFRSTGGGFFEGMVEMSSSYFRFEGYGDSDEVMVQYTSSDGITYTRTDGGEELVEFGTTIKWRSNYSSFNNVIGNFMKIGGSVFEGLYNCKEVEKINTDLFKGFMANPEETEFTDIYVKNLNVDYSAILNEIGEPYNDYVKHGAGLITEYETLDNIDGRVVIKPKVYYKLWRFQNNIQAPNFFLDNNKYYFASYNGGNFGSSSKSYLVKYDNGTITLKMLDVSDFVRSTINSSYWVYGGVSTEKCILFYDDYYFNNSYDTNIVNNPSAIYLYNPNKENELFKTYNELNYLLAPTQLTASPDYVYEKTFYGKNGVENGTLTTSVSNSFTDVNAEVYAKIQAQYNNMQPRILTDQDKTIDKNIRIIPSRSDGTPLLDTSNVTNMYNMFNSCSNLTTIPLLDTSNVTNMGYMFNSYSNLTTIPLLDTKKVNTMVDMFSSCSNLTTIPLLDTSNVTDIRGMFGHCSNLTTIPLLDTSNVTSMVNMFYNCSSLTTIPLLNTSNVTDMDSMFYNCTNLTSIPQLNTSSVTIMQGMFYNCTSLSNESLNNILYMCVHSATTTKTLKYIGLTQEQANICTTLSNYQDFVNAGWTTGY